MRIENIFFRVFLSISHSLPFLPWHPATLALPYFALLFFSLSLKLFSLFQVLYLLFCSFLFSLPLPLLLYPLPIPSPLPPPPPPYRPLYRPHLPPNVPLTWKRCALTRLYRSLCRKANNEEDSHSRFPWRCEGRPEKQTIANSAWLRCHWIYYREMSSFSSSLYCQKIKSLKMLRPSEGLFLDWSGEVGGASEKGSAAGRGFLIIYALLTAE